MSEPSASGTSPPATAPPEPPDEPPVMRLEVVRIARGAVVDVLAGEVVGVFAHVERADQHGAGGLQALDQRRIARRRAAGSRLILEPASVGKPADVEQVLDRERHAGERPERAVLRPVARSSARAFARARSATTSVNALSWD